MIEHAKPLIERPIRMIRMDEANKIRKSFFTQGQNRNQIAKKYKRAWRTVNTIVSMSREELENRGKHPSRLKQVMTPEVIQAIESYIDREEELGVKKKQRYTHSCTNFSRAQGTRHL